MTADVLLRRTVRPHEEGQRLDHLVSAWLGEPRSRTQQRAAAGRVRVGDTPAAKGHRARAGESVVVLDDPPAAAPLAPDPVVIRFDDPDVAVVVKPAGMVVHAGAGHHGPTLVDALRAQGVALAPSDDPARPGIVHRLDRGTSGLLVVAKTERARERLVAAFRVHAVQRSYWALVDGVPDEAAATIDAPLARSARVRTRFAIDPSGRAAVTHYDVRAAFGRAAQLDVRLETGRTHQVRAHLAAIGHPVTADLAYGADPVLRAQLGLRRPALHACLLGFDHPVTGAPVTVTEPLPDDLQSALDRLLQASRS